MPDALTENQVNVLRSVRDSHRWYREAREESDLREAMFLCGLGLLDYVGLPSLFALTALGRAYLSAFEASRRQPRSSP